MRNTDPTLFMLVHQAWEATRQEREFLCQANELLGRVRAVGQAIGQRVHQVIPWCCHSLSSLEEMAPVLDGVEAAMKRAGYSATDLFAVRLSLEEAMANGFKHGTKGDPDKPVRVRYLVGPDRVLAEVEDSGPGFDLASVPDPQAPGNWERPSGRGLLLMRRYTSWVRYHGRGNRVTFCKYRGATPP